MGKADSRLHGVEWFLPIRTKAHVRDRSRTSNTSSRKQKHAPKAQLIRTASAGAAISRSRTQLWLEPTRGSPRGSTGSSQGTASRANTSRERRRGRQMLVVQA